MADFRSGVRLGIDWGRARIGVAACDATGTLAYPVETVDARDPWPRLGAIVAEYEPFEVIVGLPIDLSGRAALAAEFVQERASELARRLDLPVRLVDERMSTANASRRLRQVGKDQRRQRSVIDQAAAVEILQTALDAERAGVLGELVKVEDS